jgi:hypothetical protein
MVLLSDALVPILFLALAQRVFAAVLQAESTVERRRIKGRSHALKASLGSDFGRSKKIQHVIASSLTTMMTRPDGFAPRILVTAWMMVTTRCAHAQVWASSSDNWSSFAFESTTSRTTMNSERLMTEQDGGLSTELVIFSILFSIGATLCCLWYVSANGRPLCARPACRSHTQHSPVVLRDADIAAHGKFGMTNIALCMRASFVENCTKRPPRRQRRLQWRFPFELKDHSPCREKRTNHNDG